MADNTHYFPHAAPLTLSCHRPWVMGIVNAAPDSFSGDGHSSPEAAMSHALRLINDGADLLDIGGYSTRPGADDVPLALEMERLIPLIARLRGATKAPLSVDTFRPQVARACIDAGADMINDVTAMAGTWDGGPQGGDGGNPSPAMARLCAKAGAHLLITHTAGSPQTGWAPSAYPEGIVDHARRFLAERRDLAMDAGLPGERIWLDPGFGFGKSHEDHARLLAGLGLLAREGPVVAGLSRKRWIGELSGLPVADRGPASVVMAVLAAERGAGVVRVHDVAATRAALEVRAAAVRPLAAT